MLAAKPIETRYQGYRFRSRLEARWAVFFDSLGLKWEYEKEGYDLDGTWYLPDFYLPEQFGFDQGPCWIEIKGVIPTRDDIYNIITLAEHTKNPVFLFHGPIRVPNTGYLNAPPAYVTSGINYLDWPVYWCECQECGRTGIYFDGRCEFIRCQCRKNKRYNFNSNRLVAASVAALSARFEYGG